MDKDLNYLSLAQKAGFLAAGEQNAGMAIRAGRAKLLLVASDASENARSRARGFLFGKKTPMVILPRTKDEIAGAIGKGVCSMVAVTDIGLSARILSALAEADPEKYGPAAQELARREEKFIQRKAEARAHERKKATARRKRI